MVYLTLFAIALLSATLLPLGSEALLLYDMTQGYTLLLLWLFASVGNTIGSMINYWLGSKGEGYLEKKGYVPGVKLERARGYFERYGSLSLLLSWVPIIGDPLTFIAGVLNYNIRWFIAIVFIAKSTRYAVILFFAQSLSV